MKISEIMSKIESFAPLCLALDWDNVGLLIGDQEREVSKVLISLDFTPNSLEHAIDTGAELILSHHPVLFRGTKRITDPLLLKCIEHKIALVALHTNLDTAIYSVNHALANALDFVVIEHLSPESGLSKCSNIDHLDGLYGLGLICHAKKQMNLGELALQCKERLGIPALRWWTAGKSEDSSALRIAICGGAGASVLGEAAQKADILITGDISYHVMLDSKVPIIDAGHFYTEYPVLSYLKDKVEEIGLEAVVLPRADHEYIRYSRHV